MVDMKEFLREYFEPVIWVYHVLLRKKAWYIEYPTGYRTRLMTRKEVYAMGKNSAYGKIKWTRGKNIKPTLNWEDVY